MTRCVNAHQQLRCSHVLAMLLCSQRQPAHFEAASRTCDDGHLVLQLVGTLVVVADEDGLGVLGTRGKGQNQQSALQQPTMHMHCSAGTAAGGHPEPLAGISRLKCAAQQLQQLSAGHPPCPPPSLVACPACTTTPCAEDEHVVCIGAHAFSSSYTSPHAFAADAAGGGEHPPAFLHQAGSAEQSFQGWRQPCCELGAGGVKVCRGWSA